MNILIVDDDPDVQKLLTGFLNELGHKCTAVANGTDAISAFDAEDFDLVLLDLYLPGLDGIEVLKVIKQRRDECEVIIITAYGSIPSAVEALSLGAYAYIRKPFDFVDLRHSILRVQELIDLRKAYQILSHERLKSYHLDNLVAVSPNMVEVREKIISILDDDSSVIITGEQGTGKRFVSHIIHFNGKAPGSLFLQLNPEDVKKWIDQDKFENSEGIQLSKTEFPQDCIKQGCGTLLINRLTELDQNYLSQLGKILVNHTGHISNNKGNSGLRIMATIDSSSDTDFYKDLLGKGLAPIFTHRIHLPNLRDRRECLPPLAQMFLSRIVAETGRRSFHLSRPVRDFLQLYHWPGNLTEMQNMLNRVAQTTTSRLITINDIRLVHREFEDAMTSQAQSLENILTLAEKEAIQRIFQPGNRDSNNN